MKKINLYFLLLLTLISTHINAEAINTNDIVFFNDFYFSVPKTWKQKREPGNCIYVVPFGKMSHASLTVCNEDDALDTKYFQKNDDEWETKSEGAPLSVRSQIREGITYLKAIVSCRTSDESGMHLDECFIAEVIFPNGNAISFLGKGNKDNFDSYEKLIFSVRKK